MDTIYMDLDDTFFNTEYYIRAVLKNNGLPISVPCVYTLRSFKEGDVYHEIIEGIMNHYDSIPIKEGAINSLRLLGTEYNIKLCSSYYSEGEKKSKQEYADSIGREIILVPSEDVGKTSVDMSEGICIDDSLDVISECNAKYKIQMLNKYVARNMSYKDYLIGDAFAENFYDVVDILLGGVSK